MLKPKPLPEGTRPARRKAPAAPLRAVPESSREPPLSELEFPGCVTVPMTAEEHPLWEGPRIELWDSATKTAWVLRERPFWEHEKPVGILPDLVGLIAAVRSLPIRCYGTSGLIWSGAADPPGRVPHADHVVYMDPCLCASPAHGTCTEWRSGRRRAPRLPGRCRCPCRRSPPAPPPTRTKATPWRSAPGRFGSTEKYFFISRSNWRPFRASESAVDRM